MAFALRELGQLNIGGVYIVVISPNGDEFKYTAIKADPLAVELVEKNVKAAQNVVNSVSTNNDPVVITSSNASARLDFSNGSLINTTLRNYFGFPSFKPLQKETIVSTMAGKMFLQLLEQEEGKLSPIYCRLFFPPILLL